MSVRIVSYDLKTPGKDYSKLINAISTSFSSAIKAQYSLWFVETSRSSAEVRDVLKPFIDTNDILLVDDLNEWAGYNLPSAVIDWLKKRKMAA